MVRPSVRKRISRKANAKCWENKVTTTAKKANNNGNEAPAAKATFSLLGVIIPDRLMLAEMKLGAVVAKRRCLIKTDSEDPRSLEREFHFLVGMNHKHIIKVFSVLLMLFLYPLFYGNNNGFNFRYKILASFLTFHLNKSFLPCNSLLAEHWTTMSSTSLVDECPNNLVAWSSVN